MKTHYYRLEYVLLSVFCIMAVLIVRPPILSAEEQVVARVADAVITEADLRDAVGRYVPSGVYHAGVDPKDRDKYRADALNDLIEKELLWKEAQKAGIKASDKAIDDVIQQNIKQLGSEQKMNEAIAARGYTSESFRERIRKNISVNMLLNDLTNKSAYSDEELKTYYEKNREKYRKPDAIRLYGIMISVDPTASDEVWQEKKKVAEQLLERIRSGEDFGSIAYQYSEDSFKFKSGDLGLVHRGRLTPQVLEDRAFALKKDEVSEVIKTIHGYHIFKAGELISGQTKSFDDIKAKLKKELEKERFEDNKKSLIERLRKEYHVEIIGDLKGTERDK